MATTERHTGELNLAILVNTLEELEATLSHVGRHQHWRDPSTSGHYFLIDFPSRQGHTLSAVMACCSSNATSDATQLLIRLQTLFSPRQLISLGCAQGIGETLRLGDIVIADQVDDYLATIDAVPSGGFGWTFAHRGRVFRPDHRVVQDLEHLRFAHLSTYQRWHEQCLELRQNLIAEDTWEVLINAALVHEIPAIRVGHLASGPVQEACRGFALWLQQRDLSLCAIESTAAGMMAAMTMQEPMPRSTIMRAIHPRLDSRDVALSEEASTALRAYAFRGLLAWLEAACRSGLLG